jgi:cholesterol transport system auxiliary component
MNARHLATALLCLLLAGCGLLGDNRRPTALWAVDAVPPAAAGARVDAQLVVDEPAAAEPLAGTRIALSPAEGSFGVYRDARWTERPPRMLQGLLLRALEDSGRIDGAARVGAGLRADYRLSWELRAFHVERRAAGEQARVDFSARLLRWPQGEVVASRRFEAQADVAGGGLASVVDALRRASAETLPALAGWTLDAAAADAAARAASTSGD